jgi:hypothetical protein
MSFHRKGWPTAEENTYPNDEMDALARWALRDSVAGEEPLPEVWDKIRARLEQPEAQSRPQRKGLLVAQLSWLVQLVVLGILILVVFGLSLSQGFESSLDHEHVVHGKLTPQPGSGKVVSPSPDDDMPSGYQIFRSARELTVFDHRLAP